MNILITGDSHLAAIDRALASDESICRGHKVRVIPLGNSESAHAPYFTDDGVCLKLTQEKFRTYLTELPPKQEETDVIAVSFLFHTLRMVRHSRLWSSYAPASLTDSDKPYRISAATYKHMVLNQQKYNLDLVKRLKKYVPNVVALEGPRLFSHHRTFEQHDSEIVLEADKQYRKIIRTELEKLGVPIVGCPEETFNAETGIMKTEFRPDRPEDMHHANSNFGAIVLRDLMSTSTDLMASH